VALPVRLPRLLPAAALALTAVLAVGGCTSGNAPSSPAVASGSTGANGGPAALTTAAAAAAFHRYVTTTAMAVRDNDGPLALSVVTGPQGSVVAAAIKAAGYAHRALALDPYTYGTPTFYLPQADGYPRFFVASVRRHYPGTDTSAPYAIWVGSAEAPLNGTALLLFEQSSSGSPWQLDSTSVLAFGASMPRLVADGDGAIPTVPLSATAQLAEPDITGPLQAAVVDDGPSSAASAAVAAGTLTTGMHAGASEHLQGLRPPAGDVYQWSLEGSGYAAFTLRTADGAALVFYSMDLDTLVATPSYIDKGSPIEPGPRIDYPADLDPWIGARPYRHSVQLQDLLTFAAIDPPAGGGKIQVIAVGGGLNYAAAS